MGSERFRDMLMRSPSNLVPHEEWVARGDEKPEYPQDGSDYDLALAPHFSMIGPWKLTP